MSKISQKDYLKKYLSSDDKLRKKKKKSKDKHAKRIGTQQVDLKVDGDNVFKCFASESLCRVTIIDDDDYGQNAHDHAIDESELFATNEEAPQIVGVIDERAPEVLMKQEYQDSGKWKKLGNSEMKSKEHKKKKERKRSRSPDLQLSQKASRSDDGSPDNSPPRKRRNSSDESPPRRNFEPSRVKRRDSDASPPRRARNSPQRRQRSSDNSPPRKNNVNSERWLHRKDSSDASPPRRSRKSPEIKRERRDSGDNSPPRRSRKRSASPPRQRRSRWSPEIKREPESPRGSRQESPPRSSRMTKTLDGKSSGLQNAKTLKRENDSFKDRQDKMYREMLPEMSGRDAEVVIRDRRGRNKEFELELESERRKTEAEEARKKEYDRWGKGLKQIDDLEKRYQEHMHEASKPLARMADDQDLQDHLRNQERLDDPMLEYMRRKKQDEKRKEGYVEKPKYLGQFPDNRFNIAPGYRWDGVDRSNGYEKKYFMMVNSKKSLEEEAYRYSTEDM